MNGMHSPETNENIGTQLKFFSDNYYNPSMRPLNSATLSAIQLLSLTISEAIEFKSILFFHIMKCFATMPSSFFLLCISSFVS